MGSVAVNIARQFTLHVTPTYPSRYVTSADEENSENEHKDKVLHREKTILTV